MSWILGVVAEDPESDLLRHVCETNPDASSMLVRPGVRILTGAKVLTRGFVAASLAVLRADPGSGSRLDNPQWDPFAALAGTAILGSEDGILSDSHVIEVIKTGYEAVESGAYEGQFAAVRSVGDDVELYCDSNFLRSFYVMEKTDAVLFSTHLPRIASVTGSCTLDFHVFGSHWLAHNQISEKFFLRGIKRVNGTQVVRISAGHRQVRISYGVRKRSGSTENELSGNNKSDTGTILSGNVESDHAPGADILGPFIRHIRKADTPITLALSGGLDSRYLLSALHYHCRGKFSAFVFGNPTDREVYVARKLAEALSVSLDIVPEVSDMAVLLEDPLLQTFSGELLCTTPISAAGRLLHYSEIPAVRNGAMVLDGAFGEYGRAVFYRRVEALRRMRFIRRFRPGDIEKSLSFARVSVFSDDAHRQMQRGFRDDSVAFFDDLMSFGESTSTSAAISNSASRPEDKMGLRYRRQNFFGFGQAWIDNWCKNAMPFGQNATIRRLEEIPLSSRRNGLFFRREIRRMAPVAAEFPLVKSGNLYPFSSLLSRFLSASARKVRHSGRLKPGQKDKSDDPASRLKRWVPARDQVYDIFHSQSCRTFVGYDGGSIDRLLDDVFMKGLDRTEELDWLLSLELWRNSIRVS